MSVPKIWHTSSKRHQSLSVRDSREIRILSGSWRHRTTGGLRACSGALSAFAAPDGRPYPNVVRRHNTGRVARTACHVDGITVLRRFLHLLNFRRYRPRGADCVPRRRDHGPTTFPALTQLSALP